MGCAAVLGAAIALPAGIIIGNHRAERQVAKTGGNRGVANHPAAPSRNVYSPEFRSDPYIIDQQRRVAEALETSCRQTNMHCKDAEQARQRISEAEAGG